MDRPTRALLVVNDDSGGAEPNREKLPRILDLLGPSNLEVVVRTLAPNQSASDLVSGVAKEGFGAVIVAGGDGTVSAVAAKLARTAIVLGILPVGTFNNIARSVNIPPELEAACEVIVAGNVRAIDIGSAGGSGFFFEAVGAGIDAALFPLGEEIKSGRWHRIFRAMELTFQYQTRPIEITLDRRLENAVPPPLRSRYGRRELLTNRIRRDALLTVVANGPYYGGGYRVAPGARMTDGCLTISVYRNFSKLELIRHFLSISRGHYHYSPKLETFTAAEVRLSAPDPLPVHADGKPIGQTPVVLRALPRALRVFAPPTPGGVVDPDPPLALPIPEADPEANIGVPTTR